MEYEINHSEWAGPPRARVRAKRWGSNVIGAAVEWHTREKSTGPNLAWWSEVSQKCLTWLVCPSWHATSRQPCHQGNPLSSHPHQILSDTDFNYSPHPNNALWHELSRTVIIHLTGKEQLIKKREEKKRDSSASWGKANRHFEEWGFIFPKLPWNHIKQKENNSESNDTETISMLYTLHWPL